MYSKQDFAKRAGIVVLTLGLTFAFVQSSYFLPTLHAIKRWTLRAAFILFLADVLHVYAYITKYYENDPADDENKKESSRDDEKFISIYSGDCPPENLVSDDQFESAMAEIMKQLDEGNVSGGLFDMDDIQLIVNRESAVFIGGGRAVYQQISHPFVALGIRQHSMLERGVSKRFNRTFTYMFAWYFGTPEDIEAAARAVRGLHSKVVGNLGEDVGAFKATSKFSAAEKNAIKYVSATLLDTAVFAYEMHVGMLTEAQKDEMVRKNARFTLLFGVWPSKDDPTTWKEFRSHMSALYRSQVLFPVDSAKDTIEFLFLAPSPLHAPILNVVRYSSWVQLPPPLAKKFNGRAPDTRDYMLFSLFHGAIRFVYRITPGSCRYLSGYWKMHDRIRGDRSLASRMVSRLSAMVANMVLSLAMPSRDPVESRNRVVEKRRNMTNAESNTNRSRNDVSNPKQV